MRDHAVENNTRRLAELRQDYVGAGQTVTGSSHLVDVEMGAGLSHLDEGGADQDEDEGE